MLMWGRPPPAGRRSKSPQALRQQSESSSPTRTPTAPAGRRMGSGLRFCRRRRMDRKCGLPAFDGTSGTVTEVQQFTSLATEANGELWSPDGKNILFTSDVYPECAAELADVNQCNAQKVKEAEKSKVKALVFTHLLYRHWNAYKEGKRTHIFAVKFNPLFHGKPRAMGSSGELSRDLTPGDYDAPVFSLGGQDDYAFSPDGQEICYASNHDKNPKPPPPTTICG